MNTEDILKIARLMGWQEVAPGAWTNKGERWLIGCEGIKPTFDPLISEDDAGLILDYIGALGWMITRYTGPHPDHDGPVNRVCIMRGPQDFVLGGVDVIADTRPLAICEAFVQAMERWEK